VRCVYVNNPALTRDEFVTMLATRFALSDEASRSKATMLEELERTLRQRRGRGETTALVVDEAQALSTELLEEIRLLANIETSDEKLLPLVLAGQPELSDRLEHSELRQLKQRVALRCEIAPFQLPETAAYIATRIRVAGGTPSKLFTREGIALIHEYSRGIPRTVSVICDNALVSGMALERQPVDRSIVLEVCRDFRLRENGGSGPGFFIGNEMMEAAGTASLAETEASRAPGKAEEAETGWRTRRFSFFGSKSR
jgi:type II secretory pathway predicted ATPase ExeA